MGKGASSPGLLLTFFSPSRHSLNPSGDGIRSLPRVVLVPSSLAVSPEGTGSEAWCDVEQDCSDCDCACFTDDD